MVLSSWYKVLGTCYQAFSTWYLVPSTWYQVLGTWYLVLGTKYSVLGTKYLVPSTYYSGRGTKYLALRTWYQVLGTCPFWIPMKTRWGCWTPGACLLEMGWHTTVFVRVSCNRKNRKRDTANTWLVHSIKTKRICYNKPQAETVQQCNAVQKNSAGVPLLPTMFSMFSDMRVSICIFTHALNLRLRPWSHLS